MIRIVSISAGRSDVGIYLPVWRAIAAEPDFELQILLTGEHLTQASSPAVAALENEFSVVERVPAMLAGDSPLEVAQAMGLGAIGFALAYARLKPDWLLVLGDRYEMHAAALAAVPQRLAIAHLHGGEVTHGAIDEALRHAITKYSHLHFVSTREHGRRVVQLGEEPWRVEVCGAPALDNLRSIEWMSVHELERLLDLSLKVAPLLVTFHPVTLEHDSAGIQTDALLAALDGRSRPIVVSSPNADAGRRAVLERVAAFARGRANVRLHDNLGPRAWFSLMKIAAAMVGNSSSGIIEAASFELPVVNVGLRQAGRQRSINVIDSAGDSASIGAAIERALSPDFRASLAGMKNVYGDGQASRRIVARLRSTPRDQTLFVKRFHDLP